MNWIRCADKMPNRHETVLVVYRGHVRIARYHGEYWDMGGGNHGGNLDSVSHWMPLPALPESESIVKKALLFTGLELLSQEQILGLRDMLQGAINVMVAHQNDQERGDVGWRKQTLESQLIHAKDHVGGAEAYCAGNIDSYTVATDDDGLPHIDHATARVALYYAKRNLLKKEGE